MLRRRENIESLLKQRFGVRYSEFISALKEGKEALDLFLMDYLLDNLKDQLKIEKAVKTKRKRLPVLPLLSKEELKEELFKRRKK